MERKRTITMSEIAKVSAWSVKDNSPRGCKTLPREDIRPGDKVVYDGYFTTVIEDETPEEDAANATTNFTIHDIEALTEDEARSISTEETQIKEHQVYFVTFDNAFGYSALVFKNGNQIYYANEYQLHYNGAPVEELKDKYIDKLNNKLFTDAEITDEPINSYDEYKRKFYFVQNYYTQRTRYISIFGTDNDKEKEEKTKNMHFDRIGLCYVSDTDFVERHYEMYLKLTEHRTKAEKRYDFVKSSFLYEMYNHEYGINWQADWDVLSCFGNPVYGEYKELNEYFDELNFSDVQRKAYIDARKEYFKKFDY